MKLHTKSIIRFSYLLPVLLALTVVFATQATAQVRSQKIGDNPTTINADAVLEVETTDKGFLAPRVALTSTTSPSPLSAHVSGMLVYNTASTSTGTNDVTPGLYENNGSSWIEISGSPDNLGNHTATQNIQLDGNYLSGDGGNEGVFVAANGNVGIGTDNPGSRLSINKNTHAMTTGVSLDTDMYSMSFYNGGSGTSLPRSEVYFQKAGTSQFSLRNLDDKFDILNFVGGGGISLVGSSGNVGIGTTDPKHTLDVSGSIRLSQAFAINRYWEAGWKSSNATNTSFQIQAFPQYVGFYSDPPEAVGSSIPNATARLIIEGNGNVGIGTIGPTALLSVNGTANKPGGGSWGVFSDVRSKENVQNYSKGLKELLQIRPVSFNYKESFDWGTDTYVGLVAQEIEKVVPSMVTTKEVKDIKDFKELDPNELIYILINSVKELNEKIEELYLHTIEQQKQIDALKR